jgi:hypothetical protein
MMKRTLLFFLLLPVIQGRIGSSYQKATKDTSEQQQQSMQQAHVVQQQEVRATVTYPYMICIFFSLTRTRNPHQQQEPKLADDELFDSDARRLKGSNKGSNKGSSRGSSKGSSKGSMKGAKGTKGSGKGKGKGKGRDRNQKKKRRENDRQPTQGLEFEQTEVRTAKETYLIIQFVHVNRDGPMIS